MSTAIPSQAAGNPPSKDDVPQESTGAIASDSLAAESLNQGGDFASGNAVPSAQKGASSTFNTTDTSGATALHPAASGSEREKQDALGAGSDEKGAAGLKYPEASGQPDFSGKHNLDGYTGGPSADRPSEGYSTQQPTGASDFGSNTLGSSEPSSKSTSEIKSSTNTDTEPGSAQPSGGDPSSGNNTDAGSSGTRPADAAPNYAAAVSGAIQPEGYGKPKGENLTEGDIPQTKTFTGDVGGQHDPGRVAEQTFEKITADSARSGAAGGRDYTDGGVNQYDVLSTERAGDQ